MAGVVQWTTAGTTLIDGVTLSAGTVDVNGTADAIILDADGDTTISSPTDDQIDIEIGGADDFTFTSNQFNVLSGSSISGPSSNFYTCFPLAEQQALSGAGAVNVTTFYTAWTTSSTDAGTLADGVVKGQMKKVKLVSDGGDGTLTPSNLADYTTITFADVGDYWIGVFDGTNWQTIEVGNDADGSTSPALA
jgi:hypothetical protein